MTGTPESQDGGNALGAPIRKPAPAAPEWKQKPGAPKGIEVDAKGRMRNQAPTPAVIPSPPYYVYGMFICG